MAITVLDSAGRLKETVGIVSPTDGGTGLTSVAQGDLLYGSAANTWSRLAKSAVSTQYLANTGTSNNPQWDFINLSNGVSGLLSNGNLSGIWSSTTSTVTGSQNNLDLSSSSTITNLYIAWSGASDATITGVYV